MDKQTITFFILLGLLFLASLFMRSEGFKDASGQMVSVSLSDLFSFFGSQTQTQPTQTSAPSGFDQKFFSSLKDEISKDVRETVRSQLSAEADGKANVLTDSCIDSVANQQGTDWMRYIPGKNPADYIRKDSIPCYSCNIPS